MGTDRKSFLEIRDEKVMQIGIEKAIRAFIRSTNLTNSQIAEGMEVSIELVQKIREEMNNLKTGSSSQK
jgi:hypothetical protein